MKLYYLENLRIPTEKAYGVQIMKMAEAFTDQGLEVTLILPKKYTQIKEDPFVYYQVKRNFKIKRIFSLNLIYWENFLGRVGFWLENIFYILRSLIYLIFSTKPDVIYTRQPLFAYIFRIFFHRVYYEAHTFKRQKSYQILLKPVEGIIVITKKLAELHQEILPQKKILVADDGVDLKQFNLELAKEAARQKLNLDQKSKIILYTGHLYQWKGVDTLAQAAKFLPADYQIYFVGGTAEDLANFKEKYHDLNLQIIGHRPYQEVPYWLKAADVLVIPNSSKFPISQSYTSPLKLFEYMAAKRPIVASDLPSLREVLNDNNAVFAQADQPESFATAIKKIFTDQILAKEISEQAFIDLQDYTWAKRAIKIINFIKS